MAIGLYSLHLNGVSHSLSFSSIIAMTRNADLDSPHVSSLGALPLKRDIKKTRLKFGPLLDRSERKVRGPPNTPHIAFGLEKDVGQLITGEPYT